MDNYITPAAQAVGRGVQTAAPYAENLLGLLASVPLAAYEIGQPGGSPLQFLANRQAFLQDPGFRSIAGPFLSGLFDVTGGMHPGAGSAAEAQRAVLSPEQAAQMGVQVLGPGQATPPPQWMPNLPPPSPERQLQSESARAALQLFPQLTKEQQAETLFGVKPHVEVPPGWIPTRMNTGTGGVTFQAPGATPGAELKPAMAGGQEVPGLFQTPRGGFIKDPRFKSPSAGSGDINTEFKLWRRDNPTGTFADYAAAKNQAAAGRQTAVDDAKRSALTNTTKTMVEAAPKVLHLADRVEQSLAKISTGPFASRYQEFMAGRVGAPNPDFTTYRTNVDLLQTLLMRMHVGARGSEGMLAHFANMINAGTQSPENMRAALAAIRDYANDVEAQGKPTAKEPSAAQPTGRGGMTPGGVEWQVLE